MPFVGGRVEDGDAADGEFSNALWKGVFGTDGAEEGVPAVGDGGVVQEGEVEGDQGTRSTACGNAGVDVLDILASVRRRGGGSVRYTHFGVGGACEGAGMVLSIGGGSEEVG